MRNENTRAFTLVELLVTIAIISLLMAILMVALRKAREQAKYTTCINNIHQGYLLCGMYAGDYGNYLPLGNVIDKSASGYNESWDSSDQLYMVNAMAMSTIGARYGGSTRMATCSSAEKYLTESGSLLKSIQSNYAMVERILIGWIYWGNRGDWFDSQTGQKYITPKKLTDKATSRTLLTCFCLSDFAVSQPSQWFAPHADGRFATGRGNMKPAPDGLATGFTDGSSKFVKWALLKPTTHAGQYTTYYCP